MIRALAELLALLVFAWWLDHRLDRIEAILTPDEDPGPAPEPVVCGDRRGSLICVRPYSHTGDHAARTGVSWAT